MPKYTTTPTHPLDIAARAAFCHWCSWLGTIRAAQILKINPRTLERIYAGERYLPPGLARDVAQQCEEIDPVGYGIFGRSAGELRAWADHCQQEGQG